MNFSFRILALVMIGLAGLAVAACGGEAEPDVPAVSDAWARTTAPGQETGAVYLTIEGGREADRLVSISVPPGVAGSAEIHETVPVEPGSGDHESHDAHGHGDEGHDAHAEHDEHAGHGADHDAHDEHAGHGDGMVTMRELRQVEIPAGTEITFTPGETHVMLLDLAGPLVEGDEIPLSLTFTQAGELEVTATVRDR